MKRLFAFLLVGGLITTLAAADQREGAGGVIVGPGFSFALGAPQGWIFDTQSAPSIGSRALIYPVGTNLDHTKVIIHANALPLNGLSLEKWIQQDIKSLAAEFPGIALNELPDIVTVDSLSAIIREFNPGESSYSLYERVAYIEMGKNVAIVSLSAQNKEIYHESIDAFEYVIGEFRTLGKKLILTEPPG